MRGEKKNRSSSFSNQWIMRLACAILLFVGARAAGVAPAETLASAVPAEKKNPIDAEATSARTFNRLAGIDDIEQEPHGIAPVLLGCHVKRVEPFMVRERRVRAVAQERMSPQLYSSLDRSARIEEARPSGNEPQ